MLDIRSLEYQQPILMKARTTTVVSGYADTLGRPNVCIVVEKGLKGASAVNGKVVVRVVQNTVAAYSGGTAIVTLSTATSSTPDAIAYHINMAGKGRYLGFLGSGTAASANWGVKALGFDLETTPPALASTSPTAARYANFTSITYKPAL